MTDAFDVRGRVAVVTGGYGVLGGSIAAGLARAGARIAVLGRNEQAANAKCKELRASGADALPLVADVLDQAQLIAARDALLAQWGRIDILINTAGGNVQRSRTDGVPVFGMPFDAFDEVVKLNLHGTVLPTMVFGEAMAAVGKGSIVNISSMASTRYISGVLGYSAGKAAIENVTKWLAADLARKHGAGLRVNAIAPGFFIAKQNRAVLLNEDGSYTERAKRIVERTPMGRFGDAEELNGVVQFLCSDAASFITGVIIAVDGGFSVDSGV